MLGALPAYHHAISVYDINTGAAMAFIPLLKYGMRSDSRHPSQHGFVLQKELFVNSPE